jgi:SAM-dependent methyltransferase
MDFEANSCPCKSKSGASVVFEAIDYNFSTTEKVGTIMKCLNCGCLFPGIFPNPSTLSEAYTIYYTSDVQTRKSLVKSLFNSLRKAYLDRHVGQETRRVLDFGCGSGAFLKHLHGSRPSVILFGYDPYPPKEGADLPFTFVTRDELKNSGAAYDYVTLGHSLEHLLNPDDDLDLIQHVLAKGGTLWIATPNADSFLTKIFGKHSRDVDFPRHKTVYSKKCIESILIRRGFEVTFLKSSRLNSFLNFVSCLKNVSNDDKVNILSYNTIVLIFKSIVKICFSNHNDCPELIIIAKKTS